MAFKSEFQQRIERKLLQWDMRLNDWNLKARQATAAARASYEKDLEQLRAKRNSVHMLLIILDCRDEDQIRDLRDAAEHCLYLVDSAFEQSASRFP